MTKQIPTNWLATTRAGGAMAALALIALVAAPSGADAQQRYRPSRPTVSPYLNLLRTNTSPVPNYYTFVRPVQNQIAINRQQEESIIQQRSLIDRLQSDALRVEGGPETGSRAWFRRPGTKSQFGYTGSYYQRVGGRR